MRSTIKSDDYIIDKNNDYDGCVVLFCRKIRKNILALIHVVVYKKIPARIKY